MQSCCNLAVCTAYKKYKAGKAGLKSLTLQVTKQPASSTLWFPPLVVKARALDAGADAAQAGFVEPGITKS